MTHLFALFLSVRSDLWQPNSSDNGLALHHIIQIRHVRMLLPVHQHVHLFQTPAPGLDPEEHDEQQGHDVEGRIDHVRLPADGFERKGESECDHQPDAIGPERVHPHAGRAGRVVEDLDGVHHGERGPAEGVGAHEEEHHRDRGVGSRVVVPVPVEFGERPREEEEDGPEGGCYYG